jgi:hypothetical protein
MKDCDDVNRAAPAASAEGAAVPATVPARLSGRFLKGKIGRLPHAVRQALNQRLRDSQPSDQILPWLNSLPEARQVLAKHFGGSPIILRPRTGALHSRRSHNRTSCVTPKTRIPRISSPFAIRGRARSGISSPQNPRTTDEH